MLKSFPSCAGVGAIIWSHLDLDLLHEGSCDTSTGHCLTRWSWEHNSFMALISFTFLNKFPFILFSWRVNICFHFSQVPPHPTYSNDLVYDRDHGSNSTANFHLYSWSITFALTCGYYGARGGHAGSVLIITTRTILITTTDQFSHLSHNIKMILFFCYQLFFRLPKYFSQDIFLSSISECRKRGWCWRWIIGCSHWRCDHNCWLMAGDPIPGVPGHWVSWVE